MGALRAAVYYRMSDDRQADSIDRQKSLAEPLIARNGYELTVYEEPGIPGDEVEKRPVFRRLLADALAGKFDVLVCEDFDRLIRPNPPSKFFFVMHPLIEAGIIFETVVGGRVDWDDPGCFMLHCFKAIQSNQEVKKLSWRSLSGSVKLAKNGQRQGGRTPYGYGKVVSPDGKTRRFVVDAERAEVVRWLFRTYAETGMSLGHLAREMNARNFVLPDGHRPGEGRTLWRASTLSQWLRKRCWLGDLEYGRRPQGTYHRFAGAEASNPAPYKGSGKPRAGSEDRRPAKGKGKCPALSPDKFVVVPDVFPPIIDRAIFDRVQERLEQNKGFTSPKGNGGDYLLSGGLLICGQCGHRMQGRSKRKNGGLVPAYECGKYVAHGRDGCAGGFVSEAPLVDAIARSLERELFNAEMIERFRRDAKRAADEAQAGHRADAALAKQLRDGQAKLTAQIAKMRRNLALADDLDTMRIIRDEIATTESERERLAAEVAKLERPIDTGAAERDIRLAERGLRRLRDLLTGGEPAAVRDVLREMIVEVKLFFEEKTGISRRRKKPWTRSVFSHGVIVVRLGDELARVVQSCGNQSADLSSSETPRGCATA
jgi:site-specific DNA recombinase